MISYIENNIVHNFFNILNKRDIQYVLIKNIGNELPNKLVKGKDIDIVVFEEDKYDFENIMQRSHFFVQQHPWGKSNGWEFLYGLPEFQFWKLENHDLYIDVSFKLCCKSLMPQTWIPLHQKIQDRIWQEKEWDEKFNWWNMDNETRFIYYIVRCIFDKQLFNEKYIEKIESSYLKVDMNIVRELLEVIFFQYTERLLYFIKNKKYKEIRKDYITFSGY